MRKINKKGDDMWGALGGALGLLLLIFIAYLLFGKSKDAINSADVYTDFGDYDGDGAMDLTDACPCGTDNSKQEMNSKDWCLAGYTEEQCKCANSFANSALKSVLKEKKYAEETFFKWDATSGKCLYMKDGGCKYLIYADKNDVVNTLELSTCTTIP